MILRIRLPKIGSALIGNIIGLLGLLLIVLAVGGLAHNWWWSILTAGIFSVGIAYLLGMAEDDGEEA